MNDNFTYMEFLESIDGNVEDGLWTIELLKILKLYDFRYVSLLFVYQRCVYCTTNISPSKRQYDYLDFYRVISSNCVLLQYSTLDEDLQRIQHLFQTISNDCIHIFNAQVAIDTIADFLQFNPNTVVLLLVDYSVLYPSRSCCTFVFLLWRFDQQKDFCGHYVILIGYSRSRKSFKVVDPTRYFRRHFSSVLVQITSSRKERLMLHAFLLEQITILFLLIWNDRFLYCCL